jgi:CRP-like cAMP-binding protein
MTVPERIDALRKTQLLGNAPQEALHSLAECAAERRLQSGEILFLSGDSARGLYVAVSGALRAFRESEEGREQTIYSGDDWDDLKPHLWTFFEAVKTRKPNVENAVFGNHAAIACHMANESYFRKQQVYWHAATRTVRNSP